MKFISSYLLLINMKDEKALVAQWLARCPPKAKIGGSSPPEGVDYFLLYISRSRATMSLAGC